jgi:phage-related protein
MTRLIALLALAAALGAVASGCGGEDASMSKADYEEEMGAISQELTDSLSNVGSATSVKTTVAALRKLQADFAAAADEMDAITPPKDIEAEHEELASGVREFGEQLDPIIRRVEKGNRFAVAGVQALPSLAKIVGASADITDKGYELGGSS